MTIDFNKAVEEINARNLKRAEIRSYITGEDIDDIYKPYRHHRRNKKLNILFKPRGFGTWIEDIVEYRLDDNGDEL